MKKKYQNEKGLTSISLFSGAGGLDVGFELAGFNSVFANEIEHNAAESWRANRPLHTKVMFEGNIMDYISTLSKYKGVDVLFGGPPCQGFSVAGKMDPGDERSKMVWFFMEAVKRTLPKVFVMENVAALGTLAKWENVRKGIIEKGQKLGYEISFKVHHTSDYGVPEKRDRVIFIGVKQNLGNVGLFYKKLMTYRKKPQTVRTVILSAGLYGTMNNPQTCTAKVSLAKHPVMRRSPYAGMLVNGAGRPINLDDIAPTLPASMGGNKTPIVDEEALHDFKRPNWFYDYHSGLVSGTVSPLTSKVPSTIRRLTIKECAAIQTFPIGYIFCGTKTQQYKQIGNAVPCRFAEAIAKSVRDAFLGEC